MKSISQESNNHSELALEEGWFFVALQLESRIEGFSRKRHHHPRFPSGAVKFLRTHPPDAEGAKALETKSAFERPASSGTSQTDSLSKKQV